MKGLKELRRKKISKKVAIISIISVAVFVIIIFLPRALGNISNEEEDYSEIQEDNIEQEYVREEPMGEEDNHTNEPWERGLTEDGRLHPDSELVRLWRHIFEIDTFQVDATSIVGTSDVLWLQRLESPLFPGYELAYIVEIIDEHELTYPFFQDRDWHFPIPKLLATAVSSFVELYESNATSATVLEVSVNLTDSRIKEIFLQLNDTEETLIMAVYRANPHFDFAVFKSPFTLEEIISNVWRTHGGGASDEATREWEEAQNINEDEDLEESDE